MYTANINIRKQVNCIWHAEYAAILARQALFLLPLVLFSLPRDNYTLHKYLIDYSFFIGINF